MLHNPIPSWLDRVVKASSQPPYPGILTNTEDFLRQVPRWRILKRYLHKSWALFWGGQWPLRQTALSPSAQLLWIYNAKPHFGDALMDLSGRALLAGRAPQLDVLVHPKLRALFEAEAVFRRVYTDARQCRAIAYDGIVLSEFNYGSIRTKVRHFKRLPYVSLYGFFAGPDFNRTAFSFAAVNQVFGLQYSAAALSALAKPGLAAPAMSEDFEQAWLPQTPFICLAVGGIDPDRSYNLWPQVLDLLDRHMDANSDPGNDTNDETSSESKFPQVVLLLGSDNGLDAAAEILRQAPHKLRKLRILSTVNRLSLLENQALIARARLFVGADGGLMHLAHTAGTPSVSLFPAAVKSYFRLTPACESTALQSSGAVSEILPSEVFRVIHEKLC